VRTVHQVRGKHFQWVHLRVDEGCTFRGEDVMEGRTMEEGRSMRREAGETGEEGKWGGGGWKRG